MLTIEHKSFLVESYFRKGVKLENGEWSYSVQAYFEEFRERFPTDAASFSCQDINFSLIIL
ncbi:hypothetical protein BDFB_010371 [Asbolus verrucosus]|uniref:DUF4817 domain-containing protein n=1 Tax=Asbolus verrucosus TaxID=1661398 RepID=A0A482W4P1_ASBVE|nr:hypothetical protein BDFB_010371 [Asbolus verrucosus]